MISPRHIVALFAIVMLTACGGALDSGASVTPTTDVAPTNVEAPPAATTEADEPDPTQAPAPTAATETPLPPAALSAMGEWLNDIIASGMTLDEVRQLLMESDWIENGEDVRAMPLRADGTEVWVVRATRPVMEGEEPLTALLPGAIFVAEPTTGEVVYEQFGQAAIGAEEQFFPAPTVLTDTDFTGDQTVDLTFKLTNCGASTCYDEYHIVSYHESDEPQEMIRATGYDANGQLSDNLPYVTMSYSEAYIGDQNSDSIRDLLLVGGTQGSVGAGPQRARFETYAWNGENVVLIELEYEESPLRYFKLVDANAAFDEANYPAARTLYDEVLTDDALEASGYYDDAAEEAALERYASYRLVLLDILEEDYIGAQRRAEDMAAAAPDDPIATGALETVMTFARTNSLSEACAAFTASVEPLDPDPLTPLDAMGYGNLELGAESLCPL